MKWVSVLLLLSGMIVGAAPDATAKDCADPPKSLVGTCNKAVGGHCDTQTGQWVIPQRLVAAKNDCISKNTIKKN